MSENTHGGARRNAGNKSLVEEFNIKQRGYAKSGNRISQEASTVSTRIPNLAGQNLHKENVLTQFIKKQGGASFVRGLIFSYLGSQVGKSEFRKFLKTTLTNTETIELYMRNLEKITDKVNLQTDFTIQRKKVSLER